MLRGACRLYNFDDKSQAENESLLFKSAMHQFRGVQIKC